MNGTLVISLDFELHWGGFEKWPISLYKNYFLNTRAVIPQMLDEFERANVHATWATVGMLFAQNKTELLANFPDLKPSYKVKELSAFHYITSTGIGDDEKSDPLHYAPSLISQIVQTPYQELASHTFGHYYCNEEGQTIEQFRADLQAAQRFSLKYGNRLKSLVFPRNQFNEEYLRVCFDEGIVCVRSNPLDWFWQIQSTQGESLWKRLNRGLDAYFPIGKNNTYKSDSLMMVKGLPVCIPASRLLRPYNPKEMILNKIKIGRIKSEMTRAAKNSEIYHLWWHPHNFGNFPEESMNGLRCIVNHFQYCQKNFGMKSSTMSELANHVISDRVAVV